MPVTVHVPGSVAEAVEAGAAQADERLDLVRAGVQARHQRGAAAEHRRTLLQCRDGVRHGLRDMDDW